MVAYVGHIHMKVHGRGSVETLSCGTSAAAAALAVRHCAGAGAPNKWKVQVRGGTLGVRRFPRRTASTSRSPARFADAVAPLADEYAALGGMEV